MPLRACQRSYTAQEHGSDTEMKPEVLGVSREMQQGWIPDQVHGGRNRRGERLKMRDELAAAQVALSAQALVLT